MALFARPNYNPAWAAVLMVVVWVLLKKFPGDLLAWGLSLFLLGLATVLVVDWFKDKESRRYREEELAGQEDLQILQIYARMTPEDRAQLQDSRLVRQHILGWGESRHQVVIEQGLHTKLEFTQQDVQAVWGVCTKETFAPVSTWGDETVRRRCAAALLQWGVDHGWLVPPRGPYAATYIGDGYLHMEEGLWGKK